MAKKKIEDIYKKLSQEEHILLRPDTYVGSTLVQTKDMWCYINDKVIKKEVTYIPAFLKLYDEIITNASDHKQRGGGVKNIKINITDDWKISVWNDGDGIPIAIHKEHKVYVPELIFGHLLTGQNYDDNEDRFGAGRNGLGSKLVSLFSKEFTIDCADGKNHYYQEFKNNLSEKSTPVIKKSTKSYTSISYITDENRLSIKGLEADTLALCHKRALDIAVFNPDINVYFNDELIKINTIRDWVRLHIKEENEIFYENINEHWSIALAQSPNDTFEHCSIVNGNTTWQGGTHVDYIMNQLVKKLTDDLIKGNKGIKLKNGEIKNKFHLFLVSKIANPTFDTQTKENLTIKITDKFELTDKLYKQLLKSEIVKSILEWVKLREQAELNKLNKKSAGKTVRVDKLIDAHKAGTNEGHKCYLCLAEGDCLDENTIVKVFKNDDYISIPLKEVNIGDMVITHNGNIRQIYGITKKVKECKTIYYGNKSITGSNDHRLLIYNKNSFKFEYLEINKINKDIHQLVKSKLFNIDSLYSIKKIEITDDIKFNYKIYFDNSIIESSKSHKFTILNLDKNKFELVEAHELKNNDLIVSITPSF